MSLPTKSAEAHPRGVLAARVARKLIDQHNQAVINDHSVCAKLDGDGTVADADYEAQLTASELEYTGYTPTEDAVVGALGPFPDPGQKIGEELFETLTEQIANRVNDQATIAAKLDADGGVPSAVYGRSAGQVAHLVRNVADNDRANAIARTESGDLLVGTSPVAGGGDPKVLISTDDGQTWRLLNTFTGYDDVAFVFEGEREVLFAGLDHASQAVLYRSNDYGKSWEAVETSTFDGYANFGGALVVSSGVYYVGGGDTDAPVFKSTDAGESWTQLTTLDAVDEAEVRVLLEAADGSIIAGAGGGGQVTIHRSTDEGASWTVEHTDTDHDRLMDGIVTAAGTILLVGQAEAAIANNAFRSTDDGATWAGVATGPTAALQRCIVQGSSGRIYVGDDATQLLRISDDDGASFTDVAFNHFTNATVVTVAVANRNGEVVIGTENATDGAGVQIIPDFEPEPLEALGSSVAGEGELFPGAGGGIHGDLLDALVDLHNHLSVVWHSTCAILDSDSLANADYEAELTAEMLTRRARTGRSRTDEVPIGG